MDTVISKDGTSIAFWRKGGSGEPLLLVHGSMQDHTIRWKSIIDRFSPYFTVYLMDRRGRGKSGDGEDYSLRREAEDIAALAKLIGEPVHLLGHSFGALCSIEAALLVPNLRSLILYEGVPVNGSRYYPPGIIERLQSVFDGGDKEAGLVAVFRDLLGLQEDSIRALRAQEEMWKVRLLSTPTITRELRVEESYRFVPERFKGLTVPTLFLVGGESPSLQLEDANESARTLHDARVEVLEGQGHFAMDSAPELFADTVLTFLRRS